MQNQVMFLENLTLEVSGRTILSTGRNFIYFVGHLEISKFFPLSVRSIKVATQ